MERGHGKLSFENMAADENLLMHRLKNDHPV